MIKWNKDIVKVDFSVDSGWRSFYMMSDKEYKKVKLKNTILYYLTFGKTKYKKLLQDNEENKKVSDKNKAKQKEKELLFFNSKKFEIKMDYDYGDCDYE